MRDLTGFLNRVRFGRTEDDMRKFILVVAVLAIGSTADAGPLRDRIAAALDNRPRLVRPAAVAAKPTAPVAKVMPKAAGQSPGCCCKDCQCNKPAAKK